MVCAALHLVNIVQPNARTPRPPRHPPSPLDRGRVDPAARLRALHDVTPLQPLVRVVLHPGLLRVRGEPADAEDLRLGRAGAARRRLPLEGRRHRRTRDREGRRRRGRGQPRLAFERLLLDRLGRLRLEGSAHDVRRDLRAGQHRASTRPCTSRRCGPPSGRRLRRG